MQKLKNADNVKENHRNEVGKLLLEKVGKLLLEKVGKLLLEKVGKLLLEKVGKLLLEKVGKLKRVYMLCYVPRKMTRKDVKYAEI